MEPNSSYWPDWPAVLDTQRAAQYLGASDRLLFSLVAADYLSPLTVGHCNTRFRRIDIDAALARAAAAGPNWQKGIPATLSSTTAAMEWREEQVKKAKAA